MTGVQTCALPIYQSKYYFTASFRADGSSKFSKKNRYGYFPSASLAWNFTEEDYMKEYSYLLDAGKVRLSWGMTGNNRVGDYDTYAQLELLQAARGNFSGISDVTHGIYPFNNNVSTIGAVPTSLANFDLRWETTSQSNIGVDLSFLKDRIDFTFDWYNKVTSD